MKIKNDGSQNYKLAFVLAVSLHIFLFVIFMQNIFISKPRPRQLATSKPVKIISAQTVDQKSLEAEITRLKTAEAKQKSDEEARVKRLQQAASSAKRKALAEKKRLEILKQKQRNSEKQLIAKEKAAKQRLAKIQSIKSKQEQNLKSLKQKAELAKKHQLEAAQKRKLEEQRLAKVKQKEQAELAKIQHEKEKTKQLAKQEAEKLKAEKLKAEKLAQQKREAEEKALEKEFAQKFREMAGRQKQIQSEIERYTQLITQAVGRHWILPENFDEKTYCIFIIKLAPNGSVLDVKLVRSSGDELLDRSARSAVYKASPLPVPKDPEVFATFREIRLKVRPEGYLS